MKNNLIEVYKDVLPKDVCEKLISHFEENLDAAVEGRVGGGKLDTTMKSSKDMNMLSNLSRIEYQNILSEIKKPLEKYVVKYVKKYAMHREQEDPNAINFAEENVWSRYIIDHAGLHTKRYEPKKDFFNWHEDVGTGMINHFCREVVMQFYLNDVEEGGETCFMHQDLCVKPKAGTLVMFPAGFTAKHKGNPPISNNKYILNTWLCRVIPPLEELIEKEPTRFFLPKGYYDNE